MACRAVVPKNGLNLRRHRGVARDASQNVIARPVGNVFVHAQFGPLGGQQELAISRREAEGRLGKIEHLTALERLAILASPNLTLPGFTQPAGIL